MGKNAPSFEDISKLKVVLKNADKQYWLEHVVFSYQWWLLVIAFFLSWVLWFHIVDKKRLTEFLLIGFFISLISSVLDEIGYHYMIWEYKYYLHWSIKSFWVVNLSILPVTNMLINQYFQTWKSFILANIGKALFFAFVGESVLESLDIYIPIKWHHTYSIGIFLIKGLFVRWLVIKILSIQTTSKEST